MPSPMPAPGPFAEALTQFGQENLEEILGTYKQFADRVDYRKLIAWTMRDSVEDLLQPLFIAALITITKELRLGELAAELEATEPAGPGDWEWAVRTRSSRGERIAVMLDEAAARDYADPPVSGLYAYTVMRRWIGQWEVAPDA